MVADPFSRSDDSMEIYPARKLLARVEGLYRAPGKDFQTRAFENLELGFEGIEGDVHCGHTRNSGGREPWYARGTEMRNARQLSIVAADELQAVAREMGIARLRPEWIGANILMSGVPRLSMVPSGTLLFFQGGATLKVDGQNAPCRVAGGAVAENAGMTDREAAALQFSRTAKRLRGLVAWVEKSGTISVDEEVSVRIPEQWIYQPD